MAELRDRFKEQLQQDLARATQLVWNMQNATTDPMYDTELLNCLELVKYARALHERAAIILGHVSRWELVEIEKSRVAAGKEST